MGSDAIVDFYETDRDSSDCETGYDDEYENDDEQNDPHRRKSDKRSLLLKFIQIIVCAILIGGAFVIRTIGGSVHETVGTWFFGHYNNSVFTGNTLTSPGQSDSVTVRENSTVPVPVSSEPDVV